MKKLVGDSCDAQDKFPEKRMKNSSISQFLYVLICATFRLPVKDPSWFLRTEYLHRKSISTASSQLLTLILDKRLIQFLAYGSTALRLH